MDWREKRLRVWVFTAAFAALSTLIAYIGERLPTVVGAILGLGIGATFAVIAARIALQAETKGRSWKQFFWLSLFITPLVTWLIVASMKADESSLGSTRKCPACAEYVKAEAILCKHCSTPLSPVQNPTPAQPLIGGHAYRDMYGRPIDQLRYQKLLRRRTWLTGLFFLLAVLQLVFRGTTPLSSALVGAGFLLAIAAYFAFDTARRKKILDISTNTPDEV